MDSIISSLQHPLVKRAVQIRTDKKVRLEENLVLLVGEKMVQEVSTAKTLTTLFTLKKSSIRAKENVIVSEEVLKKICGVFSPDGFAALVEMPKKGLKEGGCKILILDQLQDPGNVGTLSRTALALGWDGVIFLPDTVDPFNDKALRASKGALFFLPYEEFTMEETLAYLKQSQMALYLADMGGESIVKMSVPEKVGLILSREGQGARFWKGAKIVSVPMKAGVESLNVAVSGGILLFEMNR